MQHGLFKRFSCLDIARKTRRKQKILINVFMHNVKFICAIYYPIVSFVSEKKIVKASKNP